MQSDPSPSAPPPSDPRPSDPVGEPIRFEADAVGFGAGDRWRRWWARIMLAPPLLLGLAALLPTSRAPFPGEYFNPVDLRYGWWPAAMWFSFALCLVGAGAWSWLSRRSGPKAKKPSRQIDVTRDEIVVSRPYDYRRYRRDEIEHAFIDAAEGMVVVRLGGGRELTFSIDDNQLHPLLEAVSPDPAHHAAVVPAGSIAESVTGGARIASGCFLLSLPLALAFFGEIGNSLLAGSPIAPPLWAAFAAASALTMMLALSLRRRRAVIGTDGVRIDGLFRRRFVSHDEVAEVESMGDRGVELKRKGALYLAVAGVAPGGGLKRRIEEARAVPKGEGEARVGEMLDQGERGVAEWRQALAALLDSRSYREGAVRAEQLEQLVNDPGEEPQRRVAAAVALSGDAGRRPRLRIAADACANRDLAAALEAAAEGEIAERPLRRAEKRFRKSDERHRDG